MSPPASRCLAEAPARCRARSTLAMGIVVAVASSLEPGRFGGMSGAFAPPEPLRRHLPVQGVLPHDEVDSSACGHTGQSLIQGTAPRGIIGEKRLLEDADAQLPLETLETQLSLKQPHRNSQQQRNQEKMMQLDGSEAISLRPGDDHAFNNDTPLSSSGRGGNQSNEDSNDTARVAPLGWALLVVQAGHRAMVNHLLWKGGLPSLFSGLGLFLVVLIFMFICLFVMLQADVFDHKSGDLRYRVEMDTHRRPLASTSGGTVSPNFRSSPQLDRMRRSIPARAQSPPARAQSPPAAVATPQSSPLVSGGTPDEHTFPMLRTVNSLPPSQPALVPASPPAMTTPGIPMLCEDLVVPPSSACSLLLPAHVRAEEVSAGAFREVSVDNLENQGVFHAVFALDPALGGTRVLTLSCCEQRYASGETREIRYGVFASCRIHSRTAGASFNELQRKSPVATIHRQCDDNIFADVHSMDGASDSYRLSTLSGEMFFRILGADLHVTNSRGQMLASVATDSAIGRRTVTVLPLVDASLVVLTALALDWLR